MRRALLASAAGLVVAVSLAAPSLASGTVFKARYLCNDRGEVYPVVGAQVVLFLRDPGYNYLFGGNAIKFALTDDEGRVSFDQGGRETNFFLRLTLTDNKLAVRNWYGGPNIESVWFTDTGTNQNDVPVHDLGDQVLGDGRHIPECAIWEGLRQAYDNYVATAPPDHPPKWGKHFNVRIYAPTRFGAPYTHEDTIEWPSDYPPGNAPGHFGAMYREFGKSVVQGLQTLGDTGHLDDHEGQFGSFDQPSKPCRKTNLGHAFNDGWGMWWAGDYAPAPKCQGISANDYTVAGNVAAELASVQRFCTSGRQSMIDAFNWDLPNRPHIHTFKEFDKAAGCNPFLKPFSSAIHDSVAVSSARLNAFGKRQEAALSAQVAKLGKQLGSAVARAKNARCQPGDPYNPGDPYKPGDPFHIPGDPYIPTDPYRTGRCTVALSRLIAPYLLRIQVGEVKLLRRTLAFTTSKKGRKKVGGKSSIQWRKNLAHRARDFHLDSVKLGKKQIGLALKAAAPFLRTDHSGGTQAIAKQLRAWRKGLRKGKLPAAFSVPVPGATRLRSVPPPPPPPPGPKPDLVVDSITGFTHSTSPSLHVSVRNAGTAQAPASKLLLQSHSAFDNQTRDHTFDVPALAPGASVTIDAACDNTHASYASDSATATADSLNAVAESDESNNSRSAGGGNYCVYT